MLQNSPLTARAGTREIARDHTEVFCLKRAHFHTTFMQPMQLYENIEHRKPAEINWQLITAIGQRPVGQVICISS